MGFDLLDLIDPLHIRKVAEAHAKGKKFRVSIPARWLAPTWGLPTWDAAHDLLERAGSGDAAAKRELDAIKLAARSGHAGAVTAKTNLDAVAQLIIKGLPRPSQFIATQRRPSPLVPGSGAPRPAARAAAPAMTQAATIRRQQEEIKRLKHQGLERTQRLARQRQADQRVAAVKAEASAEKQALEAELEMLQRQLERRDLADEVRKRLEAQADQYEALLEQYERKATGEPAPAPITEATAAERPEAEQDDSAAAYPNAAPGDVEYNDAGTG